MSKPLHALERRLIKALFEKGSVRIEELAPKAGIGLDQARRAIEWLKSKKMVGTEKVIRLRALLGKEGEKAVELGLPERRLVDHLLRRGGRLSLKELAEAFRQSRGELSAALGHAKGKGWVKTYLVGSETFVEALSLPKSTPEEELLERIGQGAAFQDELTEKEKAAYKSLSRRPGFLVERPLGAVKVKLTELGGLAAKTLEEAREIEALTPELLVRGEWRKYVLRPFDVEAPAPLIIPGKKHPIQRFIDEVREIFLSLGFEEIDGPIVQPCFWNFDALFIPQDHPAREMQDTFYISGLKAGRIEDKALAGRIARVHLDGADTGSRGWGHGWSLDEARRLVLRTHTTAVTVNYLAAHKPSEARVFSVGRVFRNEKVTFKSLVEFHQIEGICVGRGISLRDIMGLLSRFYSRLGLREVKFLPTYFPYTEPSLQSVIYYEKLNRWVEVCGMGIFRPEVTLPLGVKNPVLAWGGGLERLVMLRYGVDDVRALYGNELGWLREVPLCQ